MVRAGFFTPSDGQAWGKTGPVQAQVEPWWAVAGGIGLAGVWVRTRQQGGHDQSLWRITSGAVGSALPEPARTDGARAGRDAQSITAFRNVMAPAQAGMPARAASARSCDAR